MKVPFLMAAALVLPAQMLAGAPLAAPLASIGMPPVSTPDLVLVQNAQPLSVPQDRMARLRQHRSIIENALQASGRLAATGPLEPQARALEAPEPMLAAVPQEPVSCEAAAGIVADFGFSDIRPTDCSGGVYRFQVMRDGTGYEIGVTAAGGEIADVSRQ